MRKKTNTARSLGFEHPGHTEKSDPGLDRPGEQAQELDHPRLPWRSKKCEDGNQRCPEPWIGASRAHGEKRPKIGSSKEAGSRTGSSRVAMEKQRPRGKRPTPPGAQDWSLQDTRVEMNRDWDIQRSRSQDWIIQSCHGKAKEVGKETNAAQSPGLEHPGHTERNDL